MSASIPQRPVLPQPRAERATSCRPLAEEDIRMIVGFAGGSESAELKKKIIDEYGWPNESTVFEVLFECATILKTGHMVENASRQGGRVDGSVFRRLAAHQAHLTKLVIKNQNNETFLESLWGAMTQIAMRIREIEQFKKMKRGILSQVAVFHALRSVGKNPVVPTGAEDAWFSADLIEYGRGAMDVIQVKRGGGQSVKIVAVDSISIPPVHEKHEHADTYFAGIPNFNATRFKVNLKKLSARTGRPVVGYVVVAPFEGAHEQTGVPSRSFLTEFEREYRKISAQNVSRANQ